MQIRAVFNPLSLPILSGHITHVFSICAKEEVRRVYTRRNIAAMANKKTVGTVVMRNLPVINCPGYSVSFKLFVMNLNGSITTTKLPRRPDPARAFHVWLSGSGFIDP